ncbi:MAG TPA: hypothetical protein VHA54_09295 [Solirubrobacterales bacterium]|nr:hypothetical protein [Solirubrobacterales bacterium]
MVSLLGAGSAAAREPVRVTIAWLPAGTTVREMASAGLSPGVMSAGLGKVPADQTYLDVGQGNRVFDSLYGSDLPPLGRSADCEAWDRAVSERAESAPAEIEPFLLRDEARSHGIAVFYAARPPCVFGGAKGAREGRPGGAVLEFAEASIGEARRAAHSLGPADLLIAIARPTGRNDDPLAIGLAGRGFEGNLTSDSTRLDGYVLSTDVAPTILTRFGLGVPGAMSGQAIRSEGSVDPSAVETLTARMEVISSRRGPVIGLSLAVWLGALALAALAGRGRWARPGVRLVATAVVLLPVVLLLGAAIEPGQTAEAMLAMLASPLLAAAFLATLGGYRALAAAAGLTVAAYAVDVVAGSPLTALSLLGPNPGLGVRFYGIGNELEALLAVLVVAGVGAGITGFAPRCSPRAAATAFLAIGLGAAFVFAAGRFGADVGAAIVFPVGAAVAAAAVAARRRRTALLVLAAPLAVLALLALIDLVSGANAHLTRSVLDAGGLGDLADVAQRRLRLSAHSFTRPIVFAFLPLIVLLAILAAARRERLRAWLRGRAAMRAGLLGALAATVVGTLANDSGALLLEIGAVYLLVFTAFAWAEGPATYGATAADEADRSTTLSDSCG